MIITDPYAGECSDSDDPFATAYLSGLPPARGEPLFQHK